MKISVINGPNLNLLGKREKSVYGTTTLKDIETVLQRLSEELDVQMCFTQFNSEGELVEEIQRAGNYAQGIVINPAAYTHYSIAIRDALAAVDLPTIEVHLSQIANREPFRRNSVIAPICLGGVWGLGCQSYELALRAIADYLKS